MFKMAKKILAIDGSGSSGAGGSSSSSSSGNANSSNTKATSSSKHKSSSSSSKSKQHQLDNSGPTVPANEATNNLTNNNNNKQKTLDISDFSKLPEDPRLPLNVRQIFKITKSWKAISRTMCKTGTIMFLHLFEQNESLYSLFHRFQHLNRMEIKESLELKEHAETVMTTLDHSINLLGDYDNFINYLHSIGELHRKIPGFKKEYFWVSII